MCLMAPMAQMWQMHEAQIKPADFKIMQVTAHTMEARALHRLPEIQIR